MSRFESLLKITDDDFEDFKQVCEDIEYPNIPQSKNDLCFIDSYSFCQSYLKNYYMDKESLEIISRVIPMEKYYVMSLSQFPSLYMEPHIDKEIKDMTPLEKIEFDIYAQETMQNIYRNQEEIFNNHLVLDLLDVSFKLSQMIEEYKIDKTIDEINNGRKEISLIFEEIKPTEETIIKIINELNEDKIEEFKQIIPEEFKNNQKIEETFNIKESQSIEL